MSLVTKGRLESPSVIFWKRLDIKLDKHVQNTNFRIYCLSNGKFGLVRLHSVIPMYFPVHTSQLLSSAGFYLQKKCRRNYIFLFWVYSKCYYSISVRLKLILTVEKQTSECHLSKETNTMHIIQMAQEQHAIYFGYAFFRRFRLILQES